MRFAVLGPLEVSGDRGPLPLGGRKQRLLLAALLLADGAAVSRDRLIDVLWGEAVPPSAAESLDTYVYRLRKLLGHDRLLRDAGGYRLRVEPGELDAERFEQLVARAGDAADGGDQAAAAAELSEALELWRGPIAAELLDNGSGVPQAQRLEEMRLSALESRVEAQLALGAGKELVPQLEQFVAEHPLRERLIGGLMLALYRAGRQTEALEVFQRARARLTEELGLEPGPGLHELQRRILQHDPTLGSPTFATRGGSRHRSSRLVAVGLVTAAVLAGVLALGSATDGRRPALPRGANGVVAISLSGDSLASATELTGTPVAISGGYGSVWAAEPGAGEVSRLDPVSGVVVDQVPVGGDPGSIVSGGGAIWVASSVAATVTRIDPTTETVTQTIQLPGANPGAIAYGAGRVWVADATARELFEIDPATDMLQRAVPLGLQPSALLVAGDAIWVAGYSNASVEKLDLASGRVLGRVHVGDGPAALAWQQGAVWVANRLDATVSRIDPRILAVSSTIPVESGPTALAADAGSVWVADEYSGTVERIDAMHDRVAAKYAVAASPVSLAVSAKLLSVGVAADGESHQGGTLVIVTPSVAGEGAGLTSSLIDPAIYSGADPPAFTGLSYDSLVTFQKSPGTDGLRLVPDLAVSIPTPTDAGETYTFRIRPGIRYSDGQPLRAEDFRRGIERLFRVRSIYSALFAGIDGAGACAQRPGSCDLSRGIETKNAAGTVAFHLVAPDPEFLFKLTEEAYAAPIPPGTPDREPASRTVAGTGPYQIAAVSNTHVRFARNPYFREWSHAAQPAGNPDRIVWRSVASVQAGVSDTERGHADWFWGQVPAAQYQQLELQDPAQVHSNPQFAVEFIPFNTHRPPFNDVRVRRALNYAIDRNAIARLYGGPSFAAPTCQTIAPGLPGYARYCPYTLDPRGTGTYTGPNLTAALRLVRESGTRGERVDIWGSPDYGFIPPATTGYVAGVLRSLGYNVHVHLVPITSVNPQLNRRIQISVIGDWLASWPDPSAYLPAFFGCRGSNGNGYYCNPGLDRQMQRAERLELTDPGQAQAIWQSVDRRLTDAAVWVPTVTVRDVELTSSRLHNYQYSPVWGFLADQSWLK
jgi:ABC-type transport system substrate-binding protein/DNA-binding SARP family transcriptional activator/streptogramin lyase